MKIYKRNILPFLLKEINLPRVVIILGMRQVGKTTLMKQIYDNIKFGSKIFLDLENPLYQKIFEEENYENIIYNLKNIGFKIEKKSFIF